MMSNDSTAKTLIVAILLCVVCSVVVSWSAVSLKPLQTKNKILDVKKNLLMTAGLVDRDAKEAQILEAFAKIETKIVELKTGDYVEMDIASFDSKKAAKIAGENYMIPREKDLGNIKRRAKLERVYFVKENGVIKSLIIPINGKGLWSTLYGFLVLDPDTTTIQGLGFYQHGETPGLGGEIDNPSWKKVWVGKKAFDSNWKPAVRVIKGLAKRDSAHDIDGLSGATLTANGVTGLVRYWLGSDAFGPFLSKFRSAGGNL